MRVEICNFSLSTSRYSGSVYLPPGEMEWFLVIVKFVFTYVPFFSMSAVTCSWMSLFDLCDELNVSVDKGELIEWYKMIAT